MEDYYSTLLKQLDGYTVMGLFDGKRNIEDIVTLQTGHKGRVFFFDQEPMIKSVDDALWDYIFQEPTIFANSELDSADKDYVKTRYPNFIDWYYFANALTAREWFSAQQHSYAGWTDQKQTVLDCNLLSGFRQYRVYLIYLMYNLGYHNNSYISFDGSANWRADLRNYDHMGLTNDQSIDLSILPEEKISYDNWGQSHSYYNGLMQSRIPMDFYSQVNYITVSETLCIENKKHLTEKVFKPIAAGKPFLLIAGYKNLEYLRSYGFSSFDSCWSESYDTIINPKDRINQAVSLMTTINLDKFFLYPAGSDEHTSALRNIQSKLDIFNQAHCIALRNREYFWSDKFYTLLINEAINNLAVAKQQLAAMQV